jgi:VanZ family protein
MGSWLVAVLLTHIPIKPGSAIPIAYLDKAAHAALYFMVAYLGGLRLLKRTPATPFRVLVVWAIIYLIYGILDEITQPITGRVADIGDWVFDAIGVGLATIVLWHGPVPRWARRC